MASNIDGTSEDTSPNDMTDSLHSQFEALNGRLETLEDKTKLCNLILRDLKDLRDILVVKEIDESQTDQK